MNFVCFFPSFQARGSLARDGLTWECDAAKHLQPSLPGSVNRPIVDVLPCLRWLSLAFLLRLWRDKTIALVVGCVHPTPARWKSAGCSQLRQCLSQTRSLFPSSSGCCSIPLLCVAAWVLCSLGSRDACREGCSLPALPYLALLISF